MPTENRNSKQRLQPQPSDCVDEFLASCAGHEELEIKEEEALLLEVVSALHANLCYPSLHWKRWVNFVNFVHLGEHSFSLGCYDGLGEQSQEGVVRYVHGFDLKKHASCRHSCHLLQLKKA